MNDLINFRIGRRDDNDLLINLYNKAFRTQIIKNDWEWFVYNNPYGLNNIYIIESADDNVVGSYCVWPNQAIIGQEKVNIVCAHHIVVLKEYRTAQIFIDFSEFVFKQEIRNDTNVICGTPNKDAYLPHKILSGWKDFGFLNCYYKIKPQIQQHKCERIELFTIEFENLIQTIGAKLSFYFKKTSSWLNWRYRDRPSKPYTTFAFYKSNKLEGFIVLKRWQEPDGYRKVHIMDMWAVTDRAVTELISASETFASDCNELNLWCTPTYPYRDHLEVHGYQLRESARQPIIIRVLNGEKMSLPLGPASFMYGDGDNQY